MAAFFSFIASIPGIIGAIKDIMAIFKDLFGDNPEKFLRDSADAFKTLKEADTSEKKIEAAKKIQGLIKRV